MEGMQTATARAKPWQRIFGCLADPPRWLEITLWILLLIIIIGIRAYLILLVPVHLWSKDATSYAKAAWDWLQTGLWQTDPRRGPIYSLVIAGCLKLFGTFDSLVVIQHVLGGIAVLGAIIVLRLLHGRAALVPIFLCGCSYAVYAAVLHAEHTVRNETLLFFFSTLAFAGAYLGLRRTGPGSGWLCLSGIAAGLLTLTKNIFAPFPILVLGGIIWLQRRRPGVAARQAVSFLAAFSLPFIAAQLSQRITLNEKLPAPQSGLLLYGRVAQFTILDGGIETEIKQLIRQDVEDYRALIKKTGELHNNVPLNSTAVPRMRALYRQLGKTPADLNRLCRALALEAIRAHPIEYAAQVGRDLWKLQLKGANARGPDASDMLSTRKLAERLPERPGMRLAQTLQALDEREDPRHFLYYQLAVTGAWLFVLPPGLLTSISVTALASMTRGNVRLWWLTLAGVWWFTMALLSTIASPLDRYLIPVTPVMFWSLSTAFILGWNRIVAARSRAPATAPSY